MRPRQAYGPAGIFALPLLIALASVAGLVLALTGEGARDWLAATLLATPVAMAWWAWQGRG